MTETTVKIEGMMCGMCESHINDVFRSKFNVDNVSSSHTKGESKVISKEPLDEEAVKKAIEETGYHFVSLSSKPYVKKGFFSFLGK